MRQASSEGPLTLVNLALDLHIIICTLLHPSDILTLRETCKALQLPTRKRVVWMTALRRVCHDNSLFLPSFPILDMSDVELEHAAMAPRRWIELCGAAFKRQHSESNGPGENCATLRPRTTRFIEDSLATADYSHLFIVPGGRYLVSESPNGIFIWDLGYTSNADCKLIASVEPEDDELEEISCSCIVQATPDGMGLIIFSCPFKQCSIYEFYPQSETPQLTRIAHLHLNPDEAHCAACLLPDRVLWYHFHGDSIIFKIWDYRMNYLTSFSSNIGSDKLKYYPKVIATETAIILLCLEEIIVWAIPSLPPQPPDFFDLHPTHIPPLSTIAFPDGIQVRHPGFAPLQTMSDWYCGSSQPLYFNLLCRDGELHRFEIIVKPNLIDTSLHLINTEFVPDEIYRTMFGRYSICEDTLVACCGKYDWEEFGVYTWSRFTPTTSHSGFAAKVLLPATEGGYNCFLYPASGRYVHLDRDVGGIFVVDLF